MLVFWVLTPEEHNASIFRAEAGSRRDSLPLRLTGIYLPFDDVTHVTNTHVFTAVSLKSHTVVRYMRSHNCSCGRVIPSDSASIFKYCTEVRGQTRRKEPRKRGRAPQCLKLNTEEGNSFLEQ